ncbi:lysophospholipid acyltransferase family protein [Oleispirillum naphthae]|uniref:lysophospholipid acyltransferase family protein n=1 Tax=Oleispirillum naphthae TaxID=2838853 RepID=UPI0030826BB2
MLWIKDVTRGPAAQEAVNWLAAQYARFARWTGRVSAIGEEHREAAHAMRGDGAAVYAFWHARLSLMWAFPGVVRRRTFVLISSHRDGRLIARVMERLGLNVITGSTSRGGTAALREMIHDLKRGNRIGITPDGPRGPRMRVQMGTIVLAHASGAPILPIAFSARRCRFLKSWDRMQMPLPFSRGVYIFGEPVVVPREAENLEPYRLLLEERLNAITAEADRLMGHAPTPPADPGDVRGAKR